MRAFFRTRLGAAIAAVIPLGLAIGGPYVINHASEQASEATGAQLTILGIAMIVGGAATQAWKVYLERREAKDPEAGRIAHHIAVADELVPLASTIETMTLMPGSARTAQLTVVAEAACNVLRTLAHAHRARAVVYALQPDPEQMVHLAFAGRSTEPGPFVRGTPRGDAALDFITGHRGIFYADLSKRKPSGYKATMSDYRTFASVPIWTDGGTYGMVTIDAPNAGSLDEGDLAMVKVVAEMLAIAFEAAQDDDVR